MSYYRPETFWEYVEYYLAVIEMGIKRLLGIK